jgi:DNA-binding NarL/FixJ family response regulator
VKTRRVDDRPLYPVIRIPRQVFGVLRATRQPRTNKLDATTAKRDRLVRIFVVDDSATARAALKSAVEGRADWVVVGEAVDGHHALATFHLHTPHLTLMDFIMPKMNGLDTARHLTARHPDVLILMVTTDPSTQLEKEAQGVGIKGLCPKNDIHCLLNAVEAVLGGGTYFSEEAVA